MSDTVDKNRKFLFDLNIFDDRYIEEDEDAPPPPPMFSEQELADARAEAFEKGRKEGLRESAASRAEFVARQMERIVASLPRLFEAESRRDAVYERESLVLATAILARLFPDLNRVHGFSEIRAVIADVLREHAGQAEIVIEVPEDVADGVREQISGALPRMSNTRVQVNGKADLAPGACEMFWKDGGAARDAAAMAARIGERIARMLDAGATSVQNNGKKEEQAVLPNTPSTETGNE